ncbi:ornithine cyclodeaminase [Mycobacteroides abscessus subsp. abscessus]|nr:ornithine cyclodeaminase [Mycobacteroides abscessus subsp. abscessus]
MRRGAESVLLIGTGTQGRNALPHLLAANPQLRKLMVYGTHAEGLAAVHRHLAEHNPHALLETVEDPRAAAAGADVVLATAGPWHRVPPSSWSATAWRPRPWSRPTAWWPPAPSRCG